MSNTPLRRETTNLETTLILHYYLWLAFTTTLRLEEERRFLEIKRALRGLGLL